MHTTILSERICAAAYRRQLSHILSNRPNQFYLSAGHGLGKSPLLRVIMNEIAPPENRWEINGRYFLQAAEQLESIYRNDFTTHRRHRHLFVDDLDDFFRKCHRHAPEKFTTYIGYLDDLFARLPLHQCTVVATGSVKPDQIEQLSIPRSDSDLASQWHQFWSSISMRWTTIRLNPWAHDWREEMRQWLEGEYGGQIPPELLPVWIDVIGDLSGGHPYLLIAVVQEVDDIYGSAEKSTAQRSLIEALDEQPAAEARDLIWAHLENIAIDRGLRRVRRSIQQLSDQSTELHRDTWQTLVALAEHRTGDGDAVGDVSDYRQRELLINLGLCYATDHPKKLAIPGKMIRQEIVKMARSAVPLTTGPASAAPAAGGRVGLRPDPATPDRKGIVTLADGGKGRRVALKGRSWQLLSLLADHPGEAVALNEMKDRLGLKNDGAVRSAIQRLEQKLESANLRGLLQNEHGVGYRLTGEVETGGDEPGDTH